MARAQQEIETYYMARAIRLAGRGRYTTDPNPRVGCVLVREGKIVGEGWHRRAGEDHAEIEALRNAGEKARGATAFVTLEPCSHHGRTPPCSEALIRAGVVRVVAAMQDPNPRVSGRGLKRLAAAGVETGCGILQAEAEALNPGFCKRMRSGRPFLFSKLAMSLDGRTGLASGESKWITGEQARRDVHRLRAGSSAILTGIETVLADDPSLTARLEDEAVEIVQPARVIVDSGLRTPPTAKMAGLPGKSLILTVDTHDKDAAPLEAAGFEVCRLPPDSMGRVDLNAALDFLGYREMNEVMVEAGAVLNGGLLQERLLDQLVVYMAPVILGNDGRGLFSIPEIQRMADRAELELTEMRHVGRELRMTFRLK
ncbi:MAG: bifunctional diaminohydroxyphosphoribosylaminopyrimidine deaminase/5-amino-6-(5-phosphoribosylamino)uracil reductase RibD [Pseudomonadota bacterium]